MNVLDVIIGMVVNIAFTTYIIIYSIHFDKKECKRGDKNVQLKQFKRRNKAKIKNAQLKPFKRCNKVK